MIKHKIRKRCVPTQKFPFKTVFEEQKQCDNSRMSSTATGKYKPNAGCPTDIHG